MPIYEYRCSACAAELEKLQKISDAPLIECPECGKPALVKLVSASSFRLKGSGWYETDFKTGKKKNGVVETGAETSKATDGAAAGTTTKDATPAPAATAGSAVASASAGASSPAAGNSSAA